MKWNFKFSFQSDDNIKISFVKFNEELLRLNGILIKGN